jgi:hypothetical protein
MFVVAVGGNIGLGNIQAISGIERLTTSSTTADVLTADYTEVAFSALELLFR